MIDLAKISVTRPRLGETSNEEPDSDEEELRKKQV